MKITKQEIEIGGRTLTLEHGRFAEQANAAILARYGDTVVLVTATAAGSETDLDYFPLYVEYIERLYAGGKIKGSRWVKREGKPSDDDILAARLIDRSIRPLFPKNYKKEVQIIATVLSVDSENDPEILAMVAASAALSISDIPWNGPVGSLRIGVRDHTYFANPLAVTEKQFTDLDLVVTASEKAILMIEAGANEVPEEKIIGALGFGQTEAAKIIQGITKLKEKVGKEKQQVKKEDDHEVVSLIKKEFSKQIEDYAKANITKEAGDASELKQVIIDTVGEEKKFLIGTAFEKVLRGKVREVILSGKRLDGRQHDEIRPISGEVSILPRTHGSAMFKRGQTQALTITTLAPPNLEQIVESAEGEETKRYIHHYSFPPYSVGEVGRIGSPSRREIGHGALAERALIPVIPKEDEFPYTIRVVSEIMSSNGSTSMASTCGSTMSLMDAGVPIKTPVAGIAMGLIIEGERIAVLSDIMGIEDGSGDMDFKVAGTANGVTAIQLDVKTDSLTIKILEKALSQAKTGRLLILEKMKEIINSPRKTISQYAPKVTVVKIEREKIGTIIGSGGSTIKKIMAETDATIDVEDDGSVTISGLTEESVSKAREWILGLVKEVEPGEIYEGIVKRIQPFGAFVEILPGKDGLVHVSDMSEDFVQNPEDIVKIGDKITVRVKEVDDLGRINLSMLLDPTKDKEKQQRRRDGSGARRNDRGHTFERRTDKRFDRNERRDQKQGGPHFPASRFMPKKKF